MGIQEAESFVEKCCPAQLFHAQIGESSFPSSFSLIRINMKDRSHEIVASDLFFANGVQVDLRDGGEESVLVAETWRNRITRVFIAGPRRGQKELFADMPGMPDNIRANEAGDGYWVGLASVRSKEFHGLEDVLSSWPKVRTFLHKVRLVRCWLR